MLHIRQNYVAASVLRLEEFQGLPVLIHKAGYYHTILGDDGNRIDRYIGVSVLGKIFHVSAYFGYGDNGRMVAASVGVSNTLEASRSFFPRAVVGIDEAAALYAKARDIWTKNMPWAQPLSRQDYETLADQLGFDPQPDKELSIWSDFNFSQYSLDDLPRLLSHQHRAYSVKRETEAATVAKAAAMLRESEALPGLPVLRTEARFVPLSPDPNGQRPISDYDPAIRGSRLPVHERGRPLGRDGRDQGRAPMEVRWTPSVGQESG